MGHRLYREILDGAPPEWGHPERLVALVIADDANDKTRRSWIPIQGCWRRGRWQDGIREKAGMAPSSIRRALHRLGQRGFELRVPISTGKDGRPIYAARGRSTDFYVPPLPVRPAPERRSDPDEKALTSDQKGAQFSSKRRPDPSTPPLRSPQIPSLSPRAQLVSERLPEATPEERELIIKRIEAQNPKNFPAYFRSIPRDDLDAMLEEIRGQAQPGQAPPKPPWCGTCKEDTRLTELPDGRITRCPQCHPLAVGQAGNGTAKKIEDQGDQP